MSPARMSAVGARVCQALYAHRLMSTSQLHELVMPTASRRWAQTTLARLERPGYVARAGVHDSREHAWYLTARGVLATEGGDLQARRFRMSPEAAVGSLQAHTLAVNQAALCFVRAARQRGDDERLVAWRNEHPFGLGPGHGSLIVDALVDYTVTGGHEEVYLCRVLELDRCTETVPRVVAKLRSYVRLYDYRPGWTGHPRFPAPLVILTGVPEPTLERRLTALCELSCRVPELAARPELGALVTTLPALEAAGPFRPVFVPLTDPTASVDVLGSDARRRRAV